MAYLTPTKLTCPTCDATYDITVVVGTGPHSRPDVLPYRRFHISQTSDLIIEETAGKRTGRLLCPADQTPVWENLPQRPMPQAE